MAENLDTTSLTVNRATTVPFNPGAQTILASAARTATPTIADQTNLTGKGVVVVIDTTAVTSTPSTVVTVVGKDSVSGKTYTIVASAAITGTGTIILRVYPGLTAAANLTVSDVLPYTWTITSVHGNANSHTYTVVAYLIP